MMAEEGFDNNETCSMRVKRIKMRGESIELEKQKIKTFNAIKHKLIQDLIQKERDKQMQIVMERKFLKTWVAMMVRHWRLKKWDANRNKL